MGIASTTFNGRKKRGTIHELIFDWAVNNNYDLNYLFYGEKTEKEDIGDKTLLEIQEWLNESGRGNNDIKIWFKVQFDNKFPEFVEWKKRKEKRQEQHNFPGKTNIA